MQGLKRLKWLKKYHRGREIGVRSCEWRVEKIQLAFITAWHVVDFCQSLCYK